VSIDPARMQSVLAEFASIIGLPSLAWDAQQRCRLVIDEWPLELWLTESGQIAATIIAGMLPAQDREEVAVEMLETNFHVEALCGSAFAVDPASDSVVLRRLVPAEGLTGQTLADALQKQVALVEEWSLRWSLATGMTNVTLKD